MSRGALALACVLVAGACASTAERQGRAILPAIEATLTCAARQDVVCLEALTRQPGIFHVTSLTSGDIAVHPDAADAVSPAAPLSLYRIATEREAHTQVIDVRPTGEVWALFIPAARASEYLADPDGFMEEGMFQKYVACEYEWSDGAWRLGADLCGFISD